MGHIPRGDRSICWTEHFLCPPVLWAVLWWTWKCPGNKWDANWEEQSYKHMTEAWTMMQSKKINHHLIAPKSRLVIAAFGQRYLELIWGGVWCLRGIYPENISQTAGYKKTHVLVWVLQKEIRGQMESQVQVQLLLFLRILIHVHEGFYNHLEGGEGPRQSWTAGLEKGGFQSVLNPTRQGLHFNKKCYKVISNSRKSHLQSS